MSEEEILKDDPLKKSKKIAVAVSVSVLALLTVFTFASFYWVCVDYFNFRANERDARKQLEDVRARYADEERVAKKRLAEIEAKSKAFEEDAAQRAKASETEAQNRIQEAEESARTRIKALEKEFSAKREKKQAEYQRFADELDESISAKKSDIAVLLRGYKERYDAKTNDLELVIASKNAELLEVQRMISMLPDVKDQLLVASNALVAARAQRDDALKDTRTAQEDYGRWRAKVETAQAELDEIKGLRGKLGNELEGLSKTTNDVCLVLLSLQGQVKVLQTKVSMTRSELQTVQNDVENAKTMLAGIQRQIVDAEQKRKTVEVSYAKTETELNAALEKKREAETDRDKALFEAAQAEAHWAKRKPEIEGLIKDMERILEMKSKAVKAAREVKVEGVNE